MVLYCKVMDIYVNLG